MLSGGNTGGGPSVNGPGGITGFVESVAAQVEITRCQAYEQCNNAIQEEILNERNVYAEPLAGYNWLPVEQQISNAEYIYNYLLDKGWTIQAICGLLGNIMQESYINPASSQQTINESSGVGNGYGLVHWDAPEDKFLKWSGLSKDEVNRMAQEAPKELMDLQLQYLLESSSGRTEEGDTIEREWLLIGGDKTMPYDEYIKSTANPSDLAISFCQSYERTKNGYSDRQEWAEEWYKHFQGETDIRDFYKQKGF